MKERPILFSAPMVRAILDGSKSQTRRLIKWPIMDKTQWFELDESYGIDLSNCTTPIDNLCPYGRPEDQLWVRETHMVNHVSGNKIPEAERAECEILFKATDLEWLNQSEDTEGLRWAPSIHMPRWASRIQLEITGIRVERLQDCGEADAAAEGIAPNWIGDLTGWNPEEHGYMPHDTDAEGRVPGVDIYDDCWTAKRCYQRLWESLNGPGSWDANPWVWIVEFKRVKP